jgi:oligoribonuclease NrnB/cAMP/cGMP phosphodiesterase (DHH superfamily)
MKTACVYHSIDLDGWMSAAIVKHWSNQPAKPTEHICGIFDYIGYNYGQPIPNLSEYDKVILVDVSFPKEEMLVLNKKLGIDFIWVDHHISAIKDVEEIHKDFILPNGLRDTKFAACELTWMFLFPDKPMPEIVRLLGRYDCFGHKGTEEEQKVLQFQYGARSRVYDMNDAYNYFIKDTQLHSIDLVKKVLSSGIEIYKYLCTEAKQIYKRAFPANFALSQEDIYGGGGAILYRFLCVNQDRFNPINFGIDYHKDRYDGFACFWFANGKWNFSLYNDNGEVDCSLIAKQYGGGGHKGAAGFVTNDLKSILGIW